MKKLTGLNKNEVTDISRQVADAFYDYKYNEADQGLIKYINSLEDMFIYMNKGRRKRGLMQWSIYKDSEAIKDQITN